MKAFRWLLTLLIMQPCLASDNLLKKSKHFRVAVFYEFEDRFNRTSGHYLNGLDLARKEMEKRHPDLAISLQKYSYDDNMISMIRQVQAAIKDGHYLMIGAETSRQALVMGKIANQYERIFVTGTATNPEVTNGRPWVFRTCFSDTIAATKWAEVIADRVRPGVLGVIHNVSYPYTDYLTKKFVEAYRTRLTPRDAASKVLTEKIIRDQSNFREIVTRFKNAGVTHTVILSFERDLRAFLTEAGEQRFYPVYIGSDGWGSNQNLYERYVGDSQRNSKFRAIRYFYWNNSDKRKVVVNFRSRFLQDYGYQPNSYVSSLYDTGIIVFSALARMKSPHDQDHLRKTLKNIRLKNMITSRQFKFNVHNSAEKDFYVYSISNQGIRYISPGEKIVLHP